MQFILLILFSDGPIPYDKNGSFNKKEIFQDHPTP